MEPSGNGHFSWNADAHLHAFYLYKSWEKAVNNALNEGLYNAVVENRL